MEEEGEGAFWLALCCPVNSNPGMQTELSVCYTFEQDELGRLRLTDAYILAYETVWCMLHDTDC